MKDILLEDTAFDTASEQMLKLKESAEALKEKVSKMYDDLSTALQTPAGEKLNITAKDILIKPIDDQLEVIKHISDTLKKIITSNYYKGVFIEFEMLDKNIKF
jgi:hypothetical protein